MAKERSHIPDHESEALDEGISYLWKEGALRALLTAVSSPIQALEDLMYGLALAGSIDSATGRELDVFGVLVGEYRGGLNDDEYRRILKNKARAARSDGTREALIAIFESMFEGRGAVSIPDRYPATVDFVLSTDDDVSVRFRRRAARILREAVPLGVGARFTITVSTGGFVFGGVDAGDETGSFFGGVDGGDETGDEFGGTW